MVRPVRIYSPGLIYHVLNRGNNRQIVFAEDDDYRHYLEILTRYKKKLEFKIFAYCLMTNHVHIIMQVSEKASISKIMQTVTVAHTRFYHIKYQTAGHIWQGRFKSPIISDDEYLLTTMRYVEQNPVRASMVKTPQDYQWSSFGLNIQSYADPLIDRAENPVYNSLGQTIEERREAYKHFAGTLIEDEQLKDVRRSLVDGMYYVSERFREQMHEKIKRKRSRGRPRKREG